MAERGRTLGQLAATLRERGLDASLLDRDGAPVDETGAERSVLDVTHDSRRFTDGALFCCIAGERHDGGEFADEARTGGAAALLTGSRLPVDLPQIVVSDTRRAMAIAATEVWGRPDLRIPIVGVTGTNGKTTVVSLIEQILAEGGRRCAAIGTLTGERTTPEATDLARHLATVVDSGCDAVAMEVSSHALALERVSGLRFAVAAFTNLGRDHLDFHGTPERYFEAKARLFEPGRAGHVVVNVDDVHGRLLRDAFDASSGATFAAVSAGEAAPRVERGRTVFGWRGMIVATPLVGRFNVTNALVAAECAVALGVDPPVAASALEGVTAPPGRMEPVVAGQPFVVLVDYAHTPDALEGVLEAARELGGGRLIVVVGAGGDRDPTKRPLMGEVVGRLADEVVITSDNPRSESPSAIMSAVAAGCVGVRPASIEDRREAIRHALTDRSAGDVVVIAGKGHEVTQTIGATDFPFDDRVVATEVLTGSDGFPP